MSDPLLLPIINVRRDNVLIPTTKDQIRDLWLQLQAAHRVMAEFETTVKGILIEAIDKLGPVEFGEALLIVSEEKGEWKCTNQLGALTEAVRTLSHGDETTLEQMLPLFKLVRAQSLLQGACKGMLGAEFHGKYFEQKESVLKLKDLEARRTLTEVPMMIIKDKQRQRRIANSIEAEGRVTE